MHTNPVTRTIAEAAKASGLPPKTIRYYEQIGLVRPTARSAVNYRAYDADAVAGLRFVARARALGFSTAETARLLALWREPGRSSADVKRVALGHVADLDARIAAMRAMRDTLAKLAESCHGNAQPDCAILDGLAGR